MKKIIVFAVVLVAVGALIAVYYTFIAKGPYKGDWETDDGLVSKISISKNTFPCDGKIIVGRSFALRFSVTLNMEKGQLVGINSEKRILTANLSEGQLSGTFTPSVTIGDAKEIKFSGLKRK